MKSLETTTYLFLKFSPFFSIRLPNISVDVQDILNALSEHIILNITGLGDKI